MNSLKQKAMLLKKSLANMQITSNSLVAALDDFHGRCDAAIIRPIHDVICDMRRKHENLRTPLKEIELIISQFDRIHKAEVVISKGRPIEDITGFLETIGQLLESQQFFNSHRSYEESETSLGRINCLLDDAAKMAESEFKKLLAALSKPMDPKSPYDHLLCRANTSAVFTSDLDDPINSSRRDESETDTMQEASYISPTVISPQYIALLNSLVVKLVHVGHQMECLEIYRDARATALQQNKATIFFVPPPNLGVPWESIKDNIPKWIDFMPIIVKIFAGERKLCDEVLKGIEKSLLDRNFGEVISSSLARVLIFGKAIVNVGKSPDKLFMLLDVYQMMRQLQPEMEAMFGSNTHNGMMEWFLMRTQLVDMSAGILLGFAELAVKVSVTDLCLDKCVHPLSVYTMNYVKDLLGYQATLTQLLLEYKTGDQEEGFQFRSTILTILDALQSHMEKISKELKDHGQSHLLLMNNLYYMVNSVCTTEVAKELLGDDWIQTQTSVVQQNADQYKMVSWAKVLESVSSPGLVLSTGGSINTMETVVSPASKDVVRERFESFSAQFEKLYLKQCLWKVYGHELCKSVRQSVTDFLVPAYRSFVQQFGHMVENCKYTPEDIEILVGKLFREETMETL